MLPEIGQYLDPGHAAREGNVSRRDVGLPEGVFVFVCFSRAEKIDRALYHAWLTILRRTPGTVLWLLKDTKTKTSADTFVTSHFRSVAAAYGIDPGRLVFADAMPWAAHVKRGALADLFLDTLAYNAHSTGCNSLWAGVPLLTFAGTKMAARVAAGMNRAARAQLYTARSVDDYINLAVRLARRPSRADTLRRGVFASRSDMPLFQTQSMVRALERGFRMSAEVFSHTDSHMHLVAHDC